MIKQKLHKSDLFLPNSPGRAPDDKINLIHEPCTVKLVLTSTPSRFGQSNLIEFRPAAILTFQTISDGSVTNRQILDIDSKISIQDTLNSEFRIHYKTKNMHNTCH